MTIYNLYIFDRHCQCIYFQKWTHQSKSNLGNSVNGNSVNSISQTGSSRLGLTSSRLSHSTTSSDHNSNNNTSQTNPSSASVLQSEERSSSNYMGTMTQQSGLAAGSVMSIEEEAKLVYGVILSLRNFVRKLSTIGGDHSNNNNNSQDGFISYRTSTYRLHYYETPTGLKFVLNTDPNTEGMRSVLKQIYVQLYVDFVVKNGLMRLDDTRWEISQGFLIQQQHNNNNSQLQSDHDHQQTTTNGQPPPGNISNELFRIAVDRFIRSLTVFE